MKPVVAIIGRPNVGKSTLFNRLTRTRDALVENFPGVTRDRIYGDAVWNDTAFSLVDTGGFGGREDVLFPQVGRQIRDALESADAIVLLLDGKSGLSPFDDEIAALIRGIEKPVLHVVNKIDGPDQEGILADFFRLGVDRLFPLSAEHGYGIHDFVDALTAVLAGLCPEARDAAEFMETRIAVVGRPNVGKSSLINRILQQERVVVSELPGTTRDAVDTLYRRGQRAYRLVDTAGIRRKKSVHRRLEKFSIIKALKSLDRCDVALIVLDAGDGLTDQDVTIAGYAYERGCGCIVLVNKWDLVEKNHGMAGRFQEQIRTTAKFLHFAPILQVSALTGLRVRKIFTVVDRVYAQYCTRVSTGELNRIMEEAVRRHDPPLHKGRRLKFYYTTQVSIRPPTFVSFVNYPTAVHFSYHRFLTNQIRKAAALEAVPVRLLFRRRSGRQPF